MQRKSKGEALSGAENLFLVSLGLTGDLEREELGRLRSIDPWKRKTGTKTDREQTAAQLAKAIESRDTEAGPLQEQINQAHRRLNELRSNVDQLTEENDKQQKALDQLRARASADSATSRT